MHSKTNAPSTLLIAILLPLAVGSFASLLSNPMSGSVMQQPPASPPAFLFPIVWSILYTLMGISSYLIYVSDSAGKYQALFIYALQLFFNFFWSILFFRFELYLPAFFWLLILILLIAVMIYLFYQIRPLAAYLQIPYLLWCLFAAYLNYQVYLLNK